MLMLSIVCFESSCCNVAFGSKRMALVTTFLLQCPMLQSTSKQLIYFLLVFSKRLSGGHCVSGGRMMWSYSRDKRVKVHIVVELYIMTRRGTLAPPQNLFFIICQAAYCGFRRLHNQYFATASRINIFLQHREQ